MKRLLALIALFPIVAVAAQPCTVGAPAVYCTGEVKRAPVQAHAAAKPAPSPLYGMAGIGIHSGWFGPTLGLGYKFRNHLAAEVSYMDVDDLDGLRAALVLEGHIKRYQRWHFVGEVSINALDGERHAAQTTAGFTKDKRGHHDDDAAPTRSAAVNPDQGGRATVLGLGAGVKYKLQRQLYARAMVRWFDGSEHWNRRSLATVAIIREF